jgi:hypothetical protein
MAVPRLLGFKILRVHDFDDVIPASKIEVLFA